MTSAASTAELVFGQLRAVGIAINPKWDLENMAAESMYGICYDSCKLVLVAPNYVGDGAEAKRGAFDRVRAPHEAWAQQLQSGSVPSRLPQSMRDKFAASQTICDIMKDVLQIDVDYSAVVYPEPAKTKALLQSLAHGVGDVLEQIATAVAEAEEEVVGDDAAEDAGEISIAAAVKHSLLLLRKVVDSSTRKTAAFRSSEPVAEVAPLQPAVRFCANSLCPTEDYPLLASHCSTQNEALPSFAEYVAASRVGTKAFEAMRKHRLASNNSEGRHSSRTAIPSGSATSVILPTRKAVACQLVSDSVFYGSAVALDADAAEVRRREAEEQAAADQQHTENVEALESQIAQEKEKREMDEDAIEASIAAMKEKIAEFKALTKTTKAAIKEHQRAIEAMEIEHEDLQASRNRRLAEAEARKALVLAAANPKTVLELTSRLDELRAAQDQSRAEFESKLAKQVKRLTKFKAIIEESRGDEGDMVTKLKEECKELRKQVRIANVDAANLARDWDRCPKDIDRSKYARLVTDMSASLRRQQLQIDDVMQQIRDGNAAIAGVRQRTKQIYDSVEGQIYEHAKQEAFAKEAYAGTVKLREAYTALVSAIENRGDVRREQHLLDARHAKLQKSVAYFEAADDTIRNDLDALKEEIVSLQNQIQQLQGDA